MFVAASKPEAFVFEVRPISYLLTFLARVSLNQRANPAAVAGFRKTAGNAPTLALYSATTGFSDPRLSPGCKTHKFGSAER